VARLFHIALREDWEEAVESGSYRISTRGRRLDEVGYIHLSFAHQVKGVADRWYGDAGELLLLELDPDRLSGPVRVEAVPGSPERFPHLYGEITPDAVVIADRLVAGPGGFSGPVD
jgi:glutathione S-transferase